MFKKHSAFVARAGLAILALSAVGDAPQAQAQGNRPCVQIYYDYTMDPAANPWGRVYAMTLQNLLGHFPAYQQIVEPIENYQHGNLSRCRANFYIGSAYDNYVPQEFIDDFQTTTNNVMWIGYNLWKVGNDRLPQVLGFVHGGFTKLNFDPKRAPAPVAPDDYAGQMRYNLANTKLYDDKGRPSFFKYIHYKGEKFYKFGEWKDYNKLSPDGTRFMPDKSQFNAPFEQNILKRPFRLDPEFKADPQHPEKKAKEIPIPGNWPGVVLAEAEQDKTDEKLPYAVRNGNRFYVADVPFAYMHEADRYLVFADLLFDVLGEQPRYLDKKPAVMRFEDISSCDMNEELRTIKKVMLDKKVPFHLALVPIYANPNGRVGECEDQRWVPMTTRPEFQAVLQEMRQAGGSVIMHGVSHQYTDVQNPANSGVTGDDFEFWDDANRRPVREDSVDWVLNRLEMGYSEMERSGIRPQIWEFPHYEGSPLDYLIVSRLFSWHIGRFAYVPFTATGLPAENQSLWYETTGTRGAAARRAALANLKVEFDSDPNHRYNMLYPYESYGDVHGQRVLPENLNYVTKWGKGHDQGEAMIDDMVDNLKRNKVLRDVWASFFIHPYLLEKGNTGPLEKIIKRVREHGYEFVNLDQFIADKKTIMRPPVIERSIGDITPVVR